MRSLKTDRFKLYRILTFAVLFLLPWQPLLGLPEVEVVKGSAESVDQAIKTIYVAAPSNNTNPELKKLIFTEDLVEVEAQAIERLIRDPSVPNSEKEVTLVRYTLGHPKITEALIRAKESGVRVKLITDLNPVMEGDFSNIQGNTTSAFSKAKLKDPEKSPGAKVISDLLAAGFELKKDILSQPLYNPELERKPIMHEKALLLRAGPKKNLFFGTANLAPNPRYNRIFEVEEDAFYDTYQKHVSALEDIYKKGKETKDLPDKPRTVIQFKDGSNMELAFTDGKHNPNERISELLENNTLEHIVLSHFVITHRGFLQSLGEAMRKNPKATGFAVADDRFAALRGWGLGAALTGVDVLDPFHRKTTGLTPEAFNRIESYVYQRPAIDPETGKLRIERSEEGPPAARHVWHDKTTLIDFIDSQGKPQTAVFTGSFNLSNNIANSEFQVQMNLPRESWLRKAVNHSVVQVAQSEPKWAVPNLEASLRNAMGLVFGLTDIEISRELSQKLLKSIDERDFEGMRKHISQIGSLSTQLSWKLDPDSKTERLKQFVDFLTWYEKNIPPSKAELEVRAQRIIGTALVISQPKMADHLKAIILSKVIDRPQLTIQEHQSLLNGAFKQLGLGEINPWSGMKSTLLSIESIFSPEFMKAFETGGPHQEKVLQALQKALDSNDTTWKGPAFPTLIKALSSERDASVLTVLTNGSITADALAQILDWFNSNRSRLSIENPLVELPKGHIMDTSDKEKLENRLTKLFTSQAKRGVVASFVQSEDPNLISILNKIKRQQNSELAEFEIKVPSKRTQKNRADGELEYEPIQSQNCSSLFGLLSSF